MITDISYQNKDVYNWFYIQHMPILPGLFLEFYIGCEQDRNDSYYMVSVIGAVYNVRFIFQQENLNVLYSWPLSVLEKRLWM